MKGLMLHYDFMDVNSTIIADASGQGMAGVVRNYDAGGMEFAEADIYGSGKRMIALPGGPQGGYIELPSGVLQNNEGITISFWCRLHDAGRGDMVFAFGKDRALYMRVLSKEAAEELAEDMGSFMEEMPEGSMAEEDGLVLVPCITSGGSSQEWPAANRMVLQRNRWYMLTVTLDKEPESHLKYYVDAQLVGHMKQKRMAANMLYDVNQSYIGKGVEDTDPIHADFADIRIYHSVCGEEEVASLFEISDMARVEADAAAIRLPETTRGNLRLPVSGTYGSSIIWSSSRESVMDGNGHVNRPAAGSGDARVVMQAEIRCGEANAVYDFTVTVEALPTEQDIVEHDAERLSVIRNTYVYEDLELPAVGEWGSRITYASEKEQYVSAEGKVVRPQAGEQAVSVTLTALLTQGEAQYQKDIVLTVLPERAAKTLKETEAVQVDTQQGILPQLPVRVRVVYTDGSEELQYVTWLPMDPQALETPGSYRVQGTLENGHSINGTVQVLAPGTRMLPNGKRFSLKSTRLTGTNILTENCRRDMEYLTLLDADRMLYNFRLAFGQDTKGVKPLGGWDEPMGLLRGHSTGHFLSALAYAYAQSGDTAIKEKLDYMVSELRALQKLSKGRPEDFVTACTPTNASQQLWSKDPSVWGEGFLSAYSPDQFALLEQYTPYATIWAPYYTLHKILAGLLDCYLYADSEMALEVARGIGDWVYHRLSMLDSQQLAKMWSMYIAGEYGGMNESMSTLYIITGNDAYRKTAVLFDNPKVFDGLAEGRDSISGIHANQHIPQIIGALQEYQATGNSRYYQVARNFWRIVTSHYMYAIGGVGRGENFKEPDILAGNIEGNRNCETCCVYNMLKLTKELYRYDPECVEYMDYYERGMLNQIAASQSPVTTEYRHHGVTYMLPIGPGASRHYSNDYDDFSCCHGTGMENHVKYQENVYYRTEGAVYVNLYMPSILEMENGTLELTGQFPAESMWLTARGVPVHVRLRVPYWCRGQFAVRQRGEVLYPQTQSYMDIWLAESETIELLLPYRIHLDYTMDRLDGDRVAAVMYGPLVMVALDDRQEWLTLVLSENPEQDFTITWNGEQPELVYQDLHFVSMYSAHHTNYHTYFKIKQP